MKKIKITKILMFSTMVATTLSYGTLIASCGKKETPPKVDPWTQFKKLALAETPLALRSVVSNDYIAKFHWTNDNVAVWAYGGKPAQKGDLQEITATIVIKDANEYQNFPINFDIVLNDDGYSPDDWTYSQNPNVVSWDNFKGLALQMTAPLLLAAAKKSEEWGKDGFSWTYGNPNQTKWVDGDIAQWDEYGGLATSGQEIPNLPGVDLMHGKINANEQDQTITAIISKVGHEGIYDADPIKAVIYDLNGEDIYNVKNWAFNKVEQKQSQAKFHHLFDVEYDVLKTINWETNRQPWIDFPNRNWEDKAHTTNVKIYFETHYKMTNYAVKSPQKIWNDPGIVNPGTISSKISVIIPIEHGGTAMLSFHISFQYFDKTNEQIGNCFNNTWSVHYAKINS